MARAHGATVLATQAVSLRRAACRAPEAATQALGESADALEHAAVEAKPHYSKAEASELLNVSRPTLDKWLASGLLPLEEVAGQKRQAIPTSQLLAVANELAELRELGQNRGLLAAALERLRHENPAMGPSFIETHKLPEGADADAEYVSAAPGPDWDPEDDWDVNALDFDEEDG